MAIVLIAELANLHPASAVLTPPAASAPALLHRHSARRIAAGELDTADSDSGGIAAIGFGIDSDWELGR